MEVKAIYALKSMIGLTNIILEKPDKENAPNSFIATSCTDTPGWVQKAREGKMQGHRSSACKVYSPRQQQQLQTQNIDSSITRQITRYNI